MTDVTAAPLPIGFSADSDVAGELLNTARELVRWIAHPQQVEPGTAMPDLDVSEAHPRDIAAHL